MPVAPAVLSRLIFNCETPNAMTSVVFGEMSSGASAT
jgi:hypothetical protein